MAIDKTLLSAIVSDDSETVSRILRHTQGAAARETDAKGATPLLLAAERGSHRSVRALLPHSDANAVAMESRPPAPRHPLMQAARIDQLKCVEALLPVTDLNRIPFGSTPLHAAAGAGAIKALRFLLLHLDPNALDGQGHTALMAAANCGHANCVSALLPLTDANALNERGLSALSFALLGFEARLAPIELVAAASSHAVLLRGLEDTGLHAPAAGIHAIRWGAVDALCQFLPSSVGDAAMARALDTGGSVAALLPRLFARQEQVALALETGFVCPPALTTQPNALAAWAPRAL